MKNKLFLASGVLALLLCGCGGNKESSEEQKEKVVNVIIMGGQSNMEGNTYFEDDDGKEWLKEAFNELGIDDGDCCFDGIPEVKTSFYGGGAWMIGTSSMRGSNPDDFLKGKFVNTTVGLGCGVPKKGGMGPEVGMAYNLREYASEDEPIYLIKCAFGGSSMDAGNSWGWNPETPNGKSLYKDQFKVFVENNLAAIEEVEGMKPTIKGFLWHQGENDSTGNAPSQYKQRLEKLVGAVRTDFAEYAVDEDGENIAFVDCYIYDKGDNDNASMPSGAKLSEIKTLNNAKKEFSEESDMNFVVNSSWQYEDGLKLQIQDVSEGNPGGAIGQQHYYTKDMFLLGQAYADILIDNDLL